MAFLFFGWVLIILFSSGCQFFGAEESLYDEYMNYPPLKNNLRTNPGKIFTEANVAYGNRNFEEAVKQFEKSNPNLLKYNLYYGISLMEIGNTSKARGIFDSIAAQKSIESVVAHWYKAMSYLKEKDNAGVLRALEAITDKSPYYKKAATLRTTLELNPG